MTSLAAEPTVGAAPPAPTVTVRRGGRGSQLGLGGAAVVVVGLALVPYLFSPSVSNNLTQLMTLALLASMWNLLAGYGGLISIGQQAFIGIGAYGLLALTDAGMNLWAAVPVAALIAGVISLPVSLLVFRLRAGYFAIGTWVVAEVFRLFVEQNNSLGAGAGKSLSGLGSVDPATRQANTYWTALAVLVVALVVTALLLRRRLGLGLRAIKDDEVAASALGVNVGRSKRLVYVVAAVGCGAAGAVILANTLRVQPDSAFSVQYSAFMFFMVVIGGVGTFEGPLIGAILFYVLQQEFSNDGTWYLVALGGVGVLFALLLPQGVWGLVRRGRDVSLVPLRLNVVDATRRIARRADVS
jgi:branched-chain amino acid transport system permease protein